MTVFIVMSADYSAGVEGNIGVEVVFNSKELADAFVAEAEENPKYEDVSFWVVEKTVIEE